MLPHDEWMAVCAVLLGLKSLIVGLEVKSLLVAGVVGGVTSGSWS